LKILHSSLIPLPHARIASITYFVVIGKKILPLIIF
jgi:hypothetical protein